MRVLDVGTFEGFWAFELERRGAEVVALDVDRIQQLDWPPRLRPAEDGRRGEGFELAREALGSDGRAGRALGLRRDPRARSVAASTSSSAARC